MICLKMSRLDRALTRFKRVVLITVAVAMLPFCSTAERINHEGRILGPEPMVSEPVLFNTPEADSIVSALQIFPTTSAWNEDISRRPALANSDAMIAKITSELSSSRRTLRPFYEMNFVLVPDNQSSVPIDFTYYPDESDPSPYPIPTNLPIEGWPRETGSLSLNEWQQDVNGTGGDRHSIIVQPGTGGLWETWLTQLTSSGWEAANGAKFDLKSNVPRPAGWTSGDAAGLSMFAGLVRYDECERGMVEHAIRLVVKHTRAAYIYPASHYASNPYTTDPDEPAMGQRLRLKSSFVIPDNWTIEEKAVLKALKKYGAIVADNGNFFSISVAPDDRFSDTAFDHLSSIGISNFEVVQTTGTNEGPRSPGAPSASAGADATTIPGKPLQLAGFVDASLPVTIVWKKYSGPGSVVFDDATKTNTIATFDQPGPYTLMLSADDGVHAVAYDAVVVQVSNGIQLQVNRTGENIELYWTGGNAPFAVESSPTIPAVFWDPVTNTDAFSLILPVDDLRRFFRVNGQP
ncbi:hypothetical protein GC207_09730 [bacterium]|nr:hypothetical protein [bacterium]